MTPPESSARGSGTSPLDAAERLAFLASAGEVLASSLHISHVLQQVADLAVPVLGDLCIVDLLEDGALRSVATAHVRPEKARLVAELRRRYPPSPDSPQPAGRVMASGRPEVLTRVDPEVVASHTRDAEHARLITAIGIRSHLAVPLTHRGLRLGVLNVGISESARTYTGDDLAVTEDLARRAALAIDHARLYERAQAEIAERRRVEASLRLSEARFRAVFEQSPLSIQLLGPDGLTRAVNTAWEQLWGLTLDQLAQYDMLADRQLEAAGILPLLRRAFMGEAVFLPVTRYDPDRTIATGSRHADPTRWVSAVAYPVKDADGAVQEVVLVHQDITEARRQQERLQDSEARLRMALDASRMNVWDWDLTSDLITCSENARDFWGIDVGQARDFLRVVHAEDLPRLEEALRQALTGSGAYLVEYRLTLPTGEPRWVQSRGRVERDAAGQPARLVGVTLDVSGLRRADERTRLLADAGATLGASLDYHTTLQQLSRLLVPRLADWCAVDLLDSNGNLQRVAVHHVDAAQVARASELFARYPPRRGDPQGVWHVIDTREVDWVPAIADDLLQAAAQDDEHLAVLRALGLRSYICLPLVSRDTAIGALTLVFAESGRRYEASDVELAADLARRAAVAVENAQLYQQLRDEHRRKDEFLATLAHELRNPLAPIRTGLGILRLQDTAGTGDRTLSTMERQLAHMVRLVDDLLDVSRVTRGAISLDTARVDLFTIVGAAIEATRPQVEAAGVHLAVRLPEAPIVIDADATRMAQVLGNLLTNAAKFTPHGGRVELSAAVEGADAVLRVSDTGRGIPGSMLSHIFEMFAQVHADDGHTRGGLGIGLTLVRRLVELHGGHVVAESGGPGAGSTFTVRLPLARSRLTPERDQSVQPSPVASASLRRRVLVVDDNTDAATMLAALLTQLGHDVRTAGDGPAALSLLDGFTPDLALLDIGLPGMSGYELARRLRAREDCRDVRLVAVTGWGQPDDRRRSLDAGFDEHLTKPVDPRAIREVIDDPQGTRG